MSKTYLMTGATGFLGSQLAQKILENGDKIVFVGKSKKDVSFRDRIIFLFRQFDPNQMSFVEADLSSVSSDSMYTDIKKNVDTIDGVWHLAANLSFKEEDRKKVFSANKDGMEKIIHITKKFDTVLYHTSTAYVHGRKSGLAMEQFEDRPRNFNNPYEESKFEAEQLLKDSSGLKYVIFRPSIMYDRKGEYVTNFGYYSFLIALHKFRRTFNLKKETAVYVPVPFLYYKKSYLNLMPMDIAIRWMYTISKRDDAVGLIFHIANPKPFVIKDIFKQTFKVFNIKMPLLGVSKFTAYLYFSSLNIVAFFVRPLKPIAQRIHYFKWYLLEHVYYDMENTKKFVSEDIDKHFLFSKDHIQEVATAISAKLDEYQKNKKK